MNPTLTLVLLWIIVKLMPLIYNNLTRYKVYDTIEDRQFEEVITLLVVLTLDVVILGIFILNLRDTLKH